MPKHIQNTNNIPRTKLLQKHAKNISNAFINIPNTYQGHGKTMAKKHAKTFPKHCQRIQHHTKNKTNPKQKPNKTNTYQKHISNTGEHMPKTIPKHDKKHTGTYQQHNKTYQTNIPKSYQTHTKT